MEDGIASLYSLLHDVAASEGEAASQYELYKALEDHRARLLALFDFGARSQKEKQEVESGKIVYEGKRLLLNDEFRRAALALADELDISELYCARLLKDVELEHPNADSNARIERAVVRYHDERLLTVRCLLILFAAGTPNDANLARLLDEYKTRLATAMLDLPGGRRAKLAEKVLIEIDNVARAMSAVANALTNATTNVTARAWDSGPPSRASAGRAAPARTAPP
ncbi:hypothetical protein EXIGLDRAFT_783423 [Exidia glandulosa HHB12029]|uniref:Uncharacterized protein n=1 Tax=Exidia glandulosa HHB12029 TaxID=1314781 RepID=A0A166N287_EXIGL|nr:hypothetical protein EXIGLDRAFT_783423 [Exidia glandulosa HHB12029]